jgi:hypothetical protein
MTQREQCVVPAAGPRAGDPRMDSPGSRGQLAVGCSDQVRPYQVARSPERAR